MEAVIAAGKTTTGSRGAWSVHDTSRKKRRIERSVDDGSFLCGIENDNYDKFVDNRQYYL